MNQAVATTVILEHRPRRLEHQSRIARGAIRGIDVVVTIRGKISVVLLLLGSNNSGQTSGWIAGQGWGQTGGRMLTASCGVGLALVESWWGASLRREKE